MGTKNFFHTAKMSFAPETYHTEPRSIDKCKEMDIHENITPILIRDVDRKRAHQTANQIFTSYFYFSLLLLNRKISQTSVKYVRMASHAIVSYLQLVTLVRLRCFGSILSC